MRIIIELDDETQVVETHRGGTTEPGVRVGETDRGPHDAVPTDTEHPVYDAGPAPDVRPDQQSTPGYEPTGSGGINIGPSSPR